MLTTGQWVTATLLAGWGLVIVIMYYTCKMSLELQESAQELALRVLDKMISDQQKEADLLLERFGPEERKWIIEGRKRRGR